MKPKKRITLSRAPEVFIRRAITEFVRTHPSNHYKIGKGKYFSPPLVGFAAGKDPLFRQYKKVIGRFHFTPEKIFNETFKKGKRPEVFSVISWVLPITEDVRKSNRKEDTYPSLLWSHTRWYGEQFNENLRNHVVSLLKKHGHRAVAPMVSPLFRRFRSPKVGFTSNWSERHVAYACGLGTFGLSDGFITPRGKALRLGSVVTDLPLTPSPKPYPHHRANCLYYFNKTCKTCAVRCPVHAITSRGHDKDKCQAYSYAVIGPAKKKEYGVGVTGCGLCQTGVPCEFKIPKLIQKEYKRARNKMGCR
jgi:epoxyqueuosine reductase